jgi:hypothetical protein
MVNADLPISHRGRLICLRINHFCDLNPQEQNFRRNLFFQNVLKGSGMLLTRFVVVFGLTSDGPERRVEPTTSLEAKGKKTEHRG